MRWSDPIRAALAAFALVALAACGDLPQPFRGNPGGQAGLLAAPPAYRLAIPRPAGAMLTDRQADGFAEALSTALLANEVPASATDPLPLDWRLTVEARLDGNAVVPRYTLTDPDGQRQGSAEGARTGWLEVDLGKPAAISRVVLIERAYPSVTEFAIEAQQPDDSWKAIVTGTTIGHEKETTFPTVIAQKFRLQVKQATGNLNIEEFQLYAK